MYEPIKMPHQVPLENTLNERIYIGLMVQIL